MKDDSIYLFCVVVWSTMNFTISSNQEYLEFVDCSGSVCQYAIVVSVTDK